MVSEYKAPGVYITEENAFPNSVVDVPTDIPVFIGHTEKAQRDSKDLTGVPTRIMSMVEFIDCYGNAHDPMLRVTAGPPAKIDMPDGNPYLLFNAVRLFFANGGLSCWIVSVGDYGTPLRAEALSAPIATGTGALERVPEPSILCIPEAVRLPVEDWAAVMNAALDHCGKLKSRVAILDVHDGDQPRTFDPETDVISGSQAGLRSKIVSDARSYGAAYYPWLCTDLVTMIEIDQFDEASRMALGEVLAADADLTGKPNLASLAKLIAALDATTLPSGMTLEDVHKAAQVQSAAYRDLIQDGLRQLNIMPPAGAIAGIYAQMAIDGVFRAPANIGLQMVSRPTVSISDTEQQDLNTPLDGKAVNAIRYFPQRGVMVWGARTLDGNNADFRYINLRRMTIMLEQSIEQAIRAFAFSPNSEPTWRMVKAMIEAFLNTQWKQGALAGPTPAAAYQVDVGLGSTMTSNDILDGYMRVMVKVALTRPAEFMVLTFQQQMDPT